MKYLFLFLVIAVCGCQSGPQTRLNGKFEQGIKSKAIEVKTPKNHRDSVLLFRSRTMGAFLGREVCLRRRC
ncbi:MAG: hypothetical protein ACLSDJ_06605 [Butyricimonas faecihominis]